MRHITKLLTLLPALALTSFLLAEGPPAPAPAHAPDDWTPLFNGTNLDGFHTYSNALGKNHDTAGYFKAENGAIHVLDVPLITDKREFAYIATEAEYENFHLRFQYKWGEKKHPPRNKPTTRRDAGCLYFQVGPDHVWPDSIECQVQEHDTGDIWIVGKNISVDTTVKNLDDKEKTFTPPGAGGIPFTLAVPRRIAKQGEAGGGDSLTDWNTVDIIAKGNESIHIVNGQIVNHCKNITLLDSKQPLTKGHICFQAEGSEVYYRNIEIRPLKPDESIPTDIPVLTTQPATQK